LVAAAALEEVKTACGTRGDGSAGRGGDLTGSATAAPTTRQVELQTMSVSMAMLPGTCEKQTDDDKASNKQKVAKGVGVADYVDFANTAAECNDGTSLRGRRATKDNFAVTLAFKESVTADQLDAFVAEVNAKIENGEFKVTLTVGGEEYSVKITETVTKGTKMATVTVAAPTKAPAPGTATAAPTLVVRCPSQDLSPRPCSAAR